MSRVTGVGGIFFKAKDPAMLRAWYKKHLGIDVQEWGGTAFSWVDDAGHPTAGSTVWSVAPEATVLEAIRLMADKNIGALLVMSGNQLAGVITERDYTRKVELQGKSPRDTRVRDIITTQIISVGLQHSIEDCMKLMTDHRVRHLPVVETDKVVGLISIGDLVNWIISTQSAQIDQMKQYIAGGYPCP